MTEGWFGGVSCDSNEDPEVNKKLYKSDTYVERETSGQYQLASKSPEVISRLYSL